MQLCGDHIVWRCACNSLSFTERKAQELLEMIDDALQNIVANPNMPTIHSSSNELDLCGLKTVHLKHNHDAENRKEKSIVAENCGETLPEEVSIVEKQIRTVLSKVSKIEEAQISLTSSMAQLGLDSISAIKVSSLLRREDIHLKVNDIMKLSSIRKMAAAVSKADALSELDRSDNTALLSQWSLRIGVPDILRKIHIDPGCVETCLPVTAGQLHLLAHWEKSDQQLFFPQFTYEVGQIVTTKQVYEAWSKVVQDTPILRTIFLSTNNEKEPVLQIVLKGYNSRCLNIKGQSSSPDYASDQPFVKLQVEDKEGAMELKLRIHHALYDAVSIATIIRRLEAELFGNPVENV